MAASPEAMMILGPKLPPPTVEEVETTPEERARNIELMQRHQRNVEWFNAHSHEFYEQCRGKHVCVAGSELFVGDDFGGVYAEAVAKHPDERGAVFRWFISTHRGPKFYANFRLLDDNRG